jgi:hypothetical protein
LNKNQPSTLFEIAGNFHLHTEHSDGTGSHWQVAMIAAEAGLDVIICTDHNLWVPDKEGWYTHSETGRKVLLLMGEEVHDDERSPQANHYLCLGVDREMRQYAAQSQALINAVGQGGGVGFLAHPIERAAPLYDEPEIPWLDWDVSGFTGIELWNYMSEFKGYLSSKPVAVLAAFFPSLFITGPLPETLALWDRLLSNDHRKVVAIGGADAHANVYSMGPLRRVVFPYEYLFQTVNTHLLFDASLSPDVASARAQVLDALRAGHAFVAYDLVGSSRGFRFTATGRGESVSMGDEIYLQGPIRLRVTSPLPADLRLLENGQELAAVRGQKLTCDVTQPGIYRVEAYRRFRFKRRGWVFSNPIYVRE